MQRAEGTFLEALIHCHAAARVTGFRAFSAHFFIDHGTGVVVGETMKIGSHVKIYQGESFIARSLAAGQALRGKKRHLTIEDACFACCRKYNGGDFDPRFRLRLIK